MSRLLFFCCLWCATSVHALKVDCYHVIEGEEFGGKFVTNVSFDSKVPSLEKEVIITLTGGKPSASTETLLSSDSVCGVKTDFSASCQGEDKVFQGEEWYSFKCRNGISGSVGFLGEGLVVYCEGPGVEPYLKGGISFEGCKK